MASDSIIRNDSEEQVAVDVFVGRQPIFDRELDVHAYELLFRDGLQNRAEFVDGDEATARVFSTAFMELGLERVTEGRLAFINLTRSFILGDYTELFPPDRVVLELLEDIEVDDELISAVEHLRGQGYSIALDDYELDDKTRRLVDLADIIKLDVLELDRETLRRHVEQLAGYGARLLAEKVETHDDLEECKALGFELFQGYFLCKPQVISGQRGPSDRTALMRLLARVNDPALDVAELEAIISRDVTLSYKLLRYINSSVFSLPTRIESIRHALLMLGKRKVRSWVNLIIFAGIADKPHELLVTAMVRAKMCELLAEAVEDDRPEMFFTVGLFSTLEAIMDQPMARIVSELSLTEEITEALLEHRGVLGEAVTCVLEYEHANWDRVSFQALDAAEIRDAYLESLGWVSSVRGSTGMG